MLKKLMFIFLFPVFIYAQDLYFQVKVINGYENIDPKILTMQNELRKKINLGIYYNIKEKSKYLFNYSNYGKFSPLEKLMGAIPMAKYYKIYGSELKYKYILSDLIENKQFNFKESNNDIIFFIENALTLADFYNNKNKVLSQVLSLQKKINSSKITFSQDFKNKLNFLIYKSIYTLSVPTIKSKDEGKMFREIEDDLTRKFTFLSYEVAEMYHLRALYYKKYRNNPEMCIRLAKTSLKIYDELILDKTIKNNSMIFESLYKIIGQGYIELGEQKKSNEFLSKADKILESVQLYKHAVDLLNTMVLNSIELKDISTAKELMKKSLNIAESKEGKESITYANCLTTKADLYVYNNKLKEALKILDKAKKITIKKYGEYSKERKILDSTIEYVKNKNEEF